MLSVTEIISPLADYSMVPDDILEQAQIRGTIVHQACANYAKKIWTPIPEECRGYFKSFKNWFDNYVEKVMAVEVELVDKDYQFCGHPDLIAKIKGDLSLSLIDLKTPVTHQKIWRLQLAAYYYLAIKGDYQIKRIFSLRLDANGGNPKIQEYTESYNQDFAVFLSMLNVYRFLKGGN